MATVIDDLQFKISLNYEEMEKQIDKARDGLKNVFSDADSTAKSLNTSFSSIVKKMQEFTSGSTSGITKSINKFKEMDGVTDTMRQSISDMRDAFKIGSDISGYVAQITNEINSIAFSEKEQKEITEELDTLYNNYCKNAAYNTELLAKSQAEALTVNSKLNEETLGQNKAESDLVATILRKNDAYTRLINLQRELIRAKQELESNTKDYTEFNKENNIDTSSKKYTYEGKALTEAPETIIKQFNDYADAVQDAQKNVENLTKQVEAANEVYTKALSTAIVKTKQFNDDREAQDKAFAEKYVDNVQKQQEADEKHIRAYVANWEKLQEQIESSQAEKLMSIYGSIGTAVSSVVSSIGITKSFKEITQAAGEAEKAARRLTSVFGSMSNEALAAAKELASVYGMSTTAAEQTLGYVGNLMTSYGLTKDAALELSSSVVSLGADLASFSGGTKTTTEAVQSLTMALLGNYRSAKDLGVALTDVDVKAMAVKEKLNPDKLTQAQLAMLRYKVIVQQTSNAVGDFARSQDTYYVATQQLKAAVEDLKVSFGEDIIPAITSVTRVMATLLDKVSGSPRFFKLFTESIGAMFLSFNLVNTLMKPLLSGFNSLRYSIKGLNKDVQALTVSEILNADATKEWKKAQLELNATANASKLARMTSVLSVAITVISAIVKAIKAHKEEMRDFAGASQDAITSIDAYNDAIKKSSEGTTDATDIVNKYNEAASKAAVIASLSTAAAAYDEQNKHINSLRASIKKAEGALVEYDNIAKRYGNKKVFAADYAVNERTDASKNLEEYNKELNEVLDSQKAGINSLARLYLKNASIIEEAISGELLQKIKEQAAFIQEASDAGYDLDDSLKLIGTETVDWDKKINDVIESLDRLHIKELESSGDYTEALEYNITLLDKEKKAYIASAEAQLMYNRVALRSKLNDKGESPENIETFMSQYDTLVKTITETTDEAVRSSALTELTNLLNGVVSDDDVKTYKQHIEALLKINQWYNLERSVLEQESDADILEHRKKLADKLEALEQKQNKTIEEQRADSLVQLRKSYDEYIDELYASYGGTKGITELLGMDDKATIDAFNKMYEAARKGKASAIKTGATVDGTGEVVAGSGFVQMGKLTIYGDKLKAFFDELLAAVAVYKQSEAEIITDYDNQIVDARARQAQTILALEAEKNQDLKAAYEADLKALELEEKQRIAAIGTSGEDELLIQKEFELKKQKLETEHNTKMLKLRNTLNQALLEADLKAYETNSLKTWTSWNNFRDLLDRSSVNQIISNFENLVSDMGKTLNISEDMYNQLFDNISQAIKDGKTEYEVREMLRTILASVGIFGDDFDRIWALIWKNIQDSTKNNVQTVADKVVDDFEKIVNSVEKLFGVINQFSDNNITLLKNELAAMEESYDALQDAIDKRNDQTYDNMTVAQKDALKRQDAMDEEELERLKAQMEEKEALIEEEERKQFEREKALSIANAMIDGARAAIRAYADGGPYLGPVMAAMIAALTGAQVAAIAAQPYPSYAVGAYDLPQDQMAQVHKGEMIIPKPFAEEIRENGGFGNDEIIVNVYGATDDVSVEENDSTANKQIDIYLTNRVKQMVARGELDSSLQTRYAISRNGKRG